MKTNIIYSDNKLFVYLEGSIRKREIKVLKNKMENIINEYQINDVILDTKKLDNDKLCLDILDNYNNVRIKKI